MKGRFELPSETTVESNENQETRVPTTLPTVTSASAPCRRVLTTSATKHCTVVAELHEEVMHGANEIMDVELKSSTPKFRPVTAVKSPVLRGRFRLMCDITGPSNVSNDRPVPLTAVTVTCVTDSAIPTFFNAADSHTTEEALDHDMVLQLADATIADAVKSNAPKLRPDTVTELDPDSAVFRIPNDNNGASNVNLASPVPVTAPTVTVSSNPSGSPEPGCGKRTTEVADVQLVVNATVAPMLAVPEKSTEPKFKPETTTFP